MLGQLARRILHAVGTGLRLNQPSSNNNDSPSLDCLVKETLKQEQDASTSTDPVIRSNDSISPSLDSLVNKTLKQEQDASTSTDPVIRIKGITFSPGLDSWDKETLKQEQDSQACIDSTVAEDLMKSPLDNFPLSKERPISNQGLFVLPWVDKKTIYNIMSRLELNQPSSNDNDSPSLDWVVKETLKQVQDTSTSTNPVIKSTGITLSPSLCSRIKETLKQEQDASTSTNPVVRSKGITFSPGLDSRDKETLKQEQDGQACIDSAVAGYLKKSPLENLLLSEKRPISNLGPSVLPRVDQKTAYNIMSRLELNQPSSKDNDSPSLDCLVNKTLKQEQDASTSTDPAIRSNDSISPSLDCQVNMFPQQEPDNQAGIASAVAGYFYSVAKKTSDIIMSRLELDQPSSNDNDSKSLDWVVKETLKQVQDTSTSTNPVIKSTGITLSPSLCSRIKETLKQEQDASTSTDPAIRSNDSISPSLDCRVNIFPQQETDNQAGIASAVAGYFYSVAKKTSDNIMPRLELNQPSSKDNDSPSLNSLVNKTLKQEQDASTSTDPVIRSKGIIFSPSLYSRVKEMLKQEQDASTSTYPVVRSNGIISPSLDCLDIETQKQEQDASVSLQWNVDIFSSTIARIGNCLYDITAWIGTHIYRTIARMKSSTNASTSTDPAIRSNDSISPSLDSLVNETLKQEQDASTSTDAVIRSNGIISPSLDCLDIEIKKQEQDASASLQRNVDIFSSTISKCPCGFSPGALVSPTN